MGNFDELLNKTRIVAESLNKRGAKAIDLSRKRIEYLDVKSKLSKFYEKYGMLAFLASEGEETDQAEMDMLCAQITSYREKLNALKAELDENCGADSEELKKEAAELKSEMKNVSQEAGRVLKRQMEEVKRNAKNAFKSVSQQAKDDEAKAAPSEAQPQSGGQADENKE